MSKPSGFGLAMAAAGAVASVPAAATPVTVTHSVTLNTLMQGSATTTLQFDLNNFLSTEGYNPADVIGGTVSVFGFSEASYAAPQYGNTTTIGYGYLGLRIKGYANTGAYSSCSFWGPCYYTPGYTYPLYAEDYNEFRERDVLHLDNVADQMRVTIGGTTSTDTASTQSNSTSPYTGYVYAGSATQEGSGNIFYRYDRERNVYSAIYGDLALTQRLDAAALLDLGTDGSLGIGFGAPVGQYRLDGVSFDLVVQRALASPDFGASTDVPEPSDLPLTALAIGAALAAGHLHRRRRANR